MNRCAACFTVCWPQMKADVDTGLALPASAWGAVKHAIECLFPEGGRPEVVSTWANTFAAQRPPWPCMTAWIYKPKNLYSLNDNQKGYSSLKALARRPMDLKL